MSSSLAHLDALPQNYYMWHGGTNFGRTAGGPYVITSYAFCSFVVPLLIVVSLHRYDYSAPLNEYGYPFQPKYAMMAALHSVLNEIGSSLLSSNRTSTAAGKDQTLTVFVGGGRTVALLTNNDYENAATIEFDNQRYWMRDISAYASHGSFTVAPWSVSVVVNGTVIYNTAAPVSAPPTPAPTPIASQPVFNW
jgi:hypothetical protein